MQSIGYEWYATIDGDKQSLQTLYSLPKLFFE